ncbi:MAG TPA: PAS domain-containing protein, partial [Coleofasciculaceae cyanobacterium]
WHNRPGRPRWIELLVYPIQDEAGQVLEVILMIKDVTERKQAEIALQEREATLHLFIQYAPASIAMFNCQMEYVVASQRWVQDFQVDSLEAIIGQSHYDIFPEIPERWRQIHQRCLAGAIEQCNEDLFVRADGHYQWLRWEIRPWYDLGGAIGGIIIVCEDITMRKQFQDALLQSEARLKLAQFASNSAVWDCYFPTNTVIWSPEYYQLYELDPSLEPSYDNWLCSVYPDDRDRLHRHVQQALASQVSEINQEFRVLRSDGLRWFLSIGQIFYNAAGEAIRMLGITIDITSQKQTELALQQLNEELEQRVAERTAELCQVNQQLQESNKELENFAFMASHDLKEPLRTVRNFTSLLHFTLGESIGEPGKDYLQRLDKAAQRMQTLIDDLLNLARITTATAPFVVVDLNQVMQQVIANLDVQIQRTGGQIQVGELPTLQADPVQMCQLLQNLLSNALKFRGETLPVVKIYTLRSPDTAVGGNTKVTQHHHIICLTDNGIGFDPKHRDRIFGAFERLHGRNQYEGTGMGLAICKKIVERHGGTITADSTLGQGSTFTIQLPCFSARV